MQATQGDPLQLELQQSNKRARELESQLNLRVAELDELRSLRELSAARAHEAITEAKCARLDALKAQKAAAVLQSRETSVVADERRVASRAQLEVTRQRNQLSRLTTKVLPP